MQPPPPTPLAAPLDGRRAAKLSLGITAFTAFVVGGLGATTTMVFVAEVAELCDHGDPMRSVDRRTRPGDSDGVTVSCVVEDKAGLLDTDDVGTEALFIGWGMWTVVAFLVLFAPILFGVRAILRRT